MRLFSFFFKLAKALIRNSYMNEKTCGSPAKTRKRKISHILETALVHATDYDGGKRVSTTKYNHQQYICRWPKCKNEYEHVARVA